MIAVKKQCDNISLELVWTGPDTGQVSFRRTEQAILQIIDAAKEHLTIVSFAVYKIPNIADALVRASKRGVQITIIVETPDKIDTESEYNTIKALGQEITKCSSVYFWPREKRPIIAGGKPGLLHVKCVFADGLWLFISSANMTQQAFTINMELGALIRGGLLPQKVEKQFDLLINESLLVKI
jgi:phosphatidylserine/phosphatidylglycerophosphate/cardiolipin synthase-like enzyme